MTSALRRVIAAVAAVVSLVFGVAAFPAVAAAAERSCPVPSYGATHLPSPTAYTHYDRGPPVQAAERAMSAGEPFVDQGSDGTSARPQASTTYDCDATRPLARMAIGHDAAVAALQGPGVRGVNVAASILAAFVQRSSSGFRSTDDEPMSEPTGGLGRTRTDTGVDE